MFYRHTKIFTKAKQYSIFLPVHPYFKHFIGIMPSTVCLGYTVPAVIADNLSVVVSPTWPGLSQPHIFLNKLNDTSLYRVQISFRVSKDGVFIFSLRYYPVKHSYTVQYLDINHNRVSSYDIVFVSTFCML